MPVTDLIPIPSNDNTGTTVRFLPDKALSPSAPVSASELVQMTLAAWPYLAVEVVDENVV